MVVLVALIGALLVGLIVGLLWRGAVLVGDRRVLEGLAARLEAERRMAARTQATLQQMREAARQFGPRPGSGGSS
jgi:hypothetical protein